MNLAWDQAECLVCTHIALTQLQRIEQLVEVLQQQVNDAAAAQLELSSMASTFPDASSPHTSSLRDPLGSGWSGWEWVYQRVS